MKHYSPTTAANIYVPLNDEQNSTKCEVPVVAGTSSGPAETLPYGASVTAWSGEATFSVLFMARLLT